MKRRRWVQLSGVVWCLCAFGLEIAARAQGINLYPDIFPYVDAHAPANLRTLQAWQLSGTTLRFSTLFANQGDGSYEIRRGNNVSATRYELLQRVYVGADFGPQYVDLPIGTAPIPGTAGTPNPSDLNVIWFENFTRFSLLEAPIINGMLTVGNEVVGTTKTSWRVSSNTGPLPGYAANTPKQTSTDLNLYQRVNVGWGDMYSSGASGQSIDITGVPLGPRYWLRQNVDPTNRIHETDETNNSFEVLIDLARPGEAVTFAGQFMQPGDRSVPPKLGDVNDDGLIDINDWHALKAATGTNLAGLTNTEAYLLGDLDLDRKHTLHDVELFSQYFDGANGTGAFASIQSVPEPSTWIICGTGVFLLLGWCGVSRRRLRGKWLQLLLLISVAYSATPRMAAADTSLYFENFNGLTLGPSIEEPNAGTNVWTDTPPTGWVVDDSGVPGNGPDVPGANNGRIEWSGWAFTDKVWWSTQVDDQLRSTFTLAYGAVMVADPDEWDDEAHPAGLYNAFVTTPSITIPAGTPAGRIKISFDSSWRPECCDDNPNLANNQRATVKVSYDNGPPITVLQFDSDPAIAATYHPDAPNESIQRDLQFNGSSTSLKLTFGLDLAENDWWWAIDNVHVFLQTIVEPTILEVNTTTGKMSILGATQITGYEITSVGNSLSPAGWAAGNLDSQNFGPLTTLTADFNNSNSVDAADYVLWRKAVGTTNGGDANGDGMVDQLDYGFWRQQYAQQLAAGQSWETLIATNNQLLEYYLLGNSTFATRSIGFGYNFAVDARDLVFKYSTAAHQEFTGIVHYVSGAGLGTAEIPEPATWIVSVLGILITGCFPRAVALRIR